MVYLFQADIAADGLKALRALEIFDYDLVLMDCMMPEMDDYLAKPVKKTELAAIVDKWLKSETRNVPLILPRRMLCQTK